MPTPTRPPKPFTPVVSNPGGGYPRPKPPSGLGNRSKSLPKSNRRTKSASRKSASKRRGGSKCKGR